MSARIVRWPRSSVYGCSWSMSCDLSQRVRNSLPKHSTNCSMRPAVPSMNWPASWRLKEGNSDAKDILGPERDHYLAVLPASLHLQHDWIVFLSHGATSVLPFQLF